MGWWRPYGNQITISLVAFRVHIPVTLGNVQGKGMTGQKESMVWYAMVWYNDFIFQSGPLMKSWRDESHTVCVVYH